MVQSLTSLFGRLTNHGHFKLPENDRRSGEFPDLNLKRVDDMIRDVWSGR